MHVGNINVFDEVRIPLGRALHSDAATSLGAVLGERSPLYVSEV